MRIDTMFSPAMVSTPVRRTRFSGTDLAASTSDSTASGPAKKPSKTPWYKFKLGRTRDLFWAGGLAALLGGIAVAPHVAQDTAIKVAAAFDPHGMDASRLIVKSDTNPTVAKAERVQIAADLRAMAHTEAYLQNFSKNLEKAFPDSPGAKAIQADYDIAYAQFVADMAPIKAEAARLQITPETVETTELARNNPLQTQRRQAYLGYHNALEAKSMPISAIATRASLPIRFKLAQQTQQVMTYWRDNYDTLFKPADNSEQSRADFEAGKAVVTKTVADIEKAQAQFARYGITMEDLLTDKLKQSPQKPSLDEIQEMLETGMGAKIDKDTLKADLEKVEALQALMEEIQNPRPDSDMAALQEKMDGAKEQMMSQKTKILMMVKKMDPRQFFADNYFSRANGAFDPIAESTQANFDKASKTIMTMWEEHQSGKKKHWMIKDKVDMLPVLQRQVNMFSPIATVLQDRTNDTPTYLVDFRATRDQYRRLSNSGQNALNTAMTDAYQALQDALTGGSPTSRELVFQGRWLENSSNFEPKPDEVQLRGALSIFDKKSPQ